MIHDLSITNSGCDHFLENENNIYILIINNI